MEETPSDWNFHNPLSTPKTVNVHQAPFQTPRTDPPSHFADAFYTPQQETPAHTPALHEFTVVRRPAKSSNASAITPDDPNFHVNHYTKSNTLQLPPVEPAQRLSSSPNPQALSTSLQRTLAVQKSKTETAAMDGYQMQTPPPTRDATSRRQYMYNQPAVQGTPSAGFQQVPLSTPGHQPIIPNVQQTPTFPAASPYAQQLQYSPELFAFAPNGPMTAPAVPHARYPWDGTPPLGQYPQPAPMNVQQQSFGPASAISPPVPGWPSNNVSPVELPNNDVPQQNRSTAFEEPDFWRSAQTVNSQAAPFSSNTLFSSPNASVNPNLLFSFSSPPQNVTTTANSQEEQQEADFGDRQPYEHQMRESTREKELVRKAKQQNRMATIPPSLGTSRPGLHRSNTDSGFRKMKHRSTELRPSTQTLEIAARKPSPLKRLSQASLSSIPESSRPRPRTRLVIDESGSARTETDPVDMDEPTSVWDEADSDDDEDLAIPSQRNSFIFPTEPSRSGKHARNDSGEQSFSTSKRPLSSASLASLTARLESTPLGKKNPRDSLDGNSRRFSMGSFASLQGQGQGSNDDVFGEEDTSDARAAVMKLIQERNERDDPQATLRAHNQRWSQASLNTDLTRLSQSQPAPQPSQYESAGAAPPAISPAYGSSSATSSVSPAVGFGAATPSSANSTASDGSIRCVCGVATPPTGPQSPGLMVQCESCLKWLHVRCIGLNETRMPEVYVCVFCTGTTPLARGGRIRDGRGFGGGGGVSVSPLNYKNNPFKR